MNMEKQKDGYCPRCKQDMAAIPNTGCCSFCFNHLMALEYNPANLKNPDNRTHTPAGTAFRTTEQ